jgi:hypothetical protein
MLQPEPIPFTLERLHSSLQRRKIDLTNRQRGSKGRAQEQAAANLNRVHPAEIERNSGVALKRVLHGRNNRSSTHCAIKIVVEGGRRSDMVGVVGGRQAGRRPSPWHGLRHFPTAQQLHARKPNASSFCYRNTVC